MPDQIQFDISHYVLVLRPDVISGLQYLEDDMGDEMEVSRKCACTSENALARAKNPLTSRYAFSTPIFQPMMYS